MKDENDNIKTDENADEAPRDDVEDQKVTSSEKPPKFKFQCQRTGDCCKRETIRISFFDIQRWVGDKTIFRLGHHININSENDDFKLQLAKDEDGYCVLYHRDNKSCTIHYNKPIYCKSYPLGYNGENFVLKSKECTGVGKDQLTRDELKQMRDDAREDHRGQQLLIDVYPVLQGLFYRQLAEESKKFMEALSPDEKKKMESLLKKNGDGEQGD